MGGSVLSPDRAVSKPGHPEVKRKAEAREGLDQDQPERGWPETSKAWADGLALSMSYCLSMLKCPHLFPQQEALLTSE